VDKAPLEFSDSLLVSWKTSHRDRIDELFGVATYESRVEARSAVKPMLDGNRVVFKNYGPHREENENPESELALIWRRKVREVIMPNNQKLLRILDRNRALLSASEVGVLEEFRQHCDDLTKRHTGDFAVVGGKTFPSGMDLLLKDESL